MDIVKSIRLKKDFAEWCRLHRIPAKKYPAYGARMFAIYSAVVMRNGCSGK